MKKMPPSRPRWIRRFIWVGALAGIALAVVAVVGLAFITLSTRKIDERMEQLRSSRSTQFLALYPPFVIGQKFSLKELHKILLDQGYVERPASHSLSPGDYHLSRNGGIIKLELFRPPFSAPGRTIPQMRASLVFDVVRDELSLLEMVRTNTGQPIQDFQNLPKRVGAFYAGRLRTQETVPLSEIPVSVRLAVMAIEDVRFLEHSGVSFRGTARALWADLKCLCFDQGGSTLTQQLMKNLFFSKEKVFSRKAKEAIYSLIAEHRHSKEAILEAYLNEVYLGQWGNREIHGFAEGARYYFNRDISQITLEQSATLAAIVQAPNYLNPHRKAERTIKRRNLVLRKMFEAGFILEEEYTEATQRSIGVVPQSQSLSDVYYAIDLVMSRIPERIRSRMDSETFTIYVTINPYLQNVASASLRENLDYLRKRSKEIREKEEKGVPLQSALIAVDVPNCAVLAVQGGSNYKETQYNRVIQARRQPGSLFKPFVYVTAFGKHSPEFPFTPITQIEDEPFEWKYEGQVWAPKNYDKKFRGIVTPRDALENSINVPTVKIAHSVGVEAIHDTLTRAGIRSPIPMLPSISLGSAEVSPLELAEAFTTLANLGERCELRPYLDVYDENGNQVSESRLTKARVLEKAPVFQTVNIMKGAFTHGTAKWVSRMGVPLNNFAGKTGTTNDAKDAWFVGFSPQLLVLVWVGFDEGETLGMTGSSAALPLWIRFMKKAHLFYTKADFEAPEELIPVPIDRESDATAGPRCKDVVVDYFPAGSEPTSQCALDH